MVRKEGKGGNEVEREREREGEIRRQRGREGERGREREGGILESQWWREGGRK